MIQLRLDANGQEPDLAVFAQHTHADQRAWTQLERVGEQPVVYPARGSHACYFSAGVHWTGAWFDNADGQRPGPALRLQIISDTAAADAWATWPGMWGGTQPPSGDINPLDDSSPRGPGGHAQYRQPDALLQTAIAHKASLAPPPPAAAPPPAPAVTVTDAGHDLHIVYDTHVANPAGLVVTVGRPAAEDATCNPSRARRCQQRDDRHSGRGRGTGRPSTSAWALTTHPDRRPRPRTPHPARSLPLIATGQCGRLGPRPSPLPWPCGGALAGAQGISRTMIRFVAPVVPVRWPAVITTRVPVARLANSLAVISARSTRSSTVPVTSIICG